MILPTDHLIQLQTTQTYSSSKYGRMWTL